MRPVVHGDARKRIPFRKEHRIFGVPFRVADIERRRSHQLQAAGDADRKRGDSRGSRDRPGGREKQRSGAAEHGGQQHDARRAEAVQQRQQQQAANGRADEIGPVDNVDLLSESRDRDRDDGAAREKRERGQRVDRDHLNEVLVRIIQAHADADERGERQHGGSGEQQRMQRQQAGGRAPVERAAHHVDVDSARAEAEERDRNREEREVVVHRDREDARQRQLDHQDGAGDGADADECADEPAACHFFVGVDARVGGHAAEV